MDHHLPRYPNVAPLPPKPPVYRVAGVFSRSYQALARQCEGGLDWGRAAAFWEAAESYAAAAALREAAGSYAVDRAACLALACSKAHGDAWRDYRRAVYGDAAKLLSARDDLTYQAFTFRWLLYNGCLNDSVEFAGFDPVEDVGSAQFLVAGLDLSPREDGLLNAALNAVRAPGQRRVVVGPDGRAMSDRDDIANRAVAWMASYDSGFWPGDHGKGVGVFGAYVEVRPWVDVALSLNRRPGNLDETRSVCTIYADGGGKPGDEGLHDLAGA